jgi:hypothetical protein
MTCSTVASIHAFDRTYPIHARRLGHGHVQRPEACGFVSGLRTGSVNKGKRHADLRKKPNGKCGEDKRARLMNPCGKTSVKGINRPNVVSVGNLDQSEQLGRMQTLSLGLGHLGITVCVKVKASSREPAANCRLDHLSHVSLMVVVVGFPGLAGGWERKKRVGTVDTRQTNE